MDATTTSSSKKIPSKEIKSWKEAGNLLKEFAVNLGQQQKLLTALSTLFENGPPFDGNVESGTKKVPNKRKRNTDPLKPKRPTSSYFYFVSSYHFFFGKQFTSDHLLADDRSHEKS